MDEPKPSRSGGSVNDLSWADGERLSTEQQQLHPDIERINRWANDNTDTFAGVWLDNDAFLAGTGPVRIGVGIAQPDLDEVAPELEALVQDPTRLVLVTKQFSTAVLRAAHDRVLDRWMQEGSNPRVTGCGVEVRANTLKVMLREPDASLEERIRADNSDIEVTFVYGYVTFG